MGFRLGLGFGESCYCFKGRGLNLGKPVATESCSRFHESSGMMLSDPACRLPGMSTVSIAFIMEVSDPTLT